MRPVDLLLGGRVVARREQVLIGRVFFHGLGDLQGELFKGFLCRAQQTLDTL